jgi:hypothetical protein
LEGVEREKRKKERIVNENDMREQRGKKRGINRLKRETKREEKEGMEGSGPQSKMQAVPSSISTWREPCG